MQDSLWGPTEPVLKKAYLFVLQLSHDLTRFKAHCEEKMRGLVASTVGAMEIQQAKQRQERKVVWLLLTLCSEHVVQSRPRTDAPCIPARTVVLKAWPRAPRSPEKSQGCH